MTDTRDNKHTQALAETQKTICVACTHEGKSSGQSIGGESRLAVLAYRDILKSNPLDFELGKNLGLAEHPVMGKFTLPFYYAS